MAISWNNGFRNPIPRQLALSPPKSGTLMNQNSYSPHPINPLILRYNYDLPSPTIPPLLSPRILARTPIHTKMRVAPIHLLFIAMATEAASAERIVNLRNEGKKRIRALTINEEASMPMDFSSLLAAGIEAGSEADDNVTPFVGSKASKSSGKSGKSGSKNPSESPSSDPSEAPSETQTPSSDPSEIPSSKPSETQTPSSDPSEIPSSDPSSSTSPSTQPTPKPYSKASKNSKAKEIKSQVYFEGMHFGSMSM